MTLLCRPRASPPSRGQGRGPHTPQQGDVTVPAITETLVAIGPRLRARACTHLKSGTTGLSAPLPLRALASGGEGSGVGGAFSAINLVEQRFMARALSGAAPSAPRRIGSWE